MKHKIIVCALLGTVLLCLCAGCRLAEPDAARAPEQDRLIGVYVTREYLDLFDMESYLRDNAGRLVDGGGIEISPEDSSAYGGRIWAERTDSGDWVFEDLDGFGYYAYRYVNESEEGVANHLDEGIVGGGMNYIVNDGGERVELSGTVYVTPGAGLEFYCNPVYQTADGAVYLTGGSGIDTNGEREGEATTMSVEDSVTVTENGESRTDSCRAEMRFEIVWEPVSVTVIQMDENSRVLHRERFTPDAVPESLTLEPGCAYVVAQAERRSPDGETALSRRLADIDPASEEPAELETFRAREEGICLRQVTRLVSAAEEVSA